MKVVCISSLCVYFWLCGAAAGTTIVPKTLPLDNPQAYVFAVPAIAGGSSRLVVIDGHDLRIYEDLNEPAARTIQLPAAASAVDLYDVDQDGALDALVVAGNQLVTRPIAPRDETPAWNLLFERSSLYTDTAGLPFPQVLAVQRSDMVVIALPQVNGFEFHSLDGELQETVEYGQQDGGSGVTSIPFTVESSPALTGGVETEMYHHVRSHRVAGPVDAVSETSQSSARSASEAAELPSDQWPSFPLRLEGANAEVLYALAPPNFEDTYLRLRLPRGSGEGPSGIGPPRRYPGRVLLSGQTLPDFNGDGFVDIVSWKPQFPGTSLSSTILLIRDSSRLVNLMVHLFNPQTGLYEAEPLISIRARLPSSWFGTSEHQSPIRNLLYKDFDSDGFLDIGFSTDRNEYSIWTYRSDFGSSPAYVIRAPSRINTIVQEVHLDSEKTIVFRGLGSLFLVNIPAYH